MHILLSDQIQKNLIGYTWFNVKSIRLVQKRTSGQ